MDITLSVVIVNYNGVKFLENCINSINKSISGDFNYEIIIVDNNSTDESVSVIKKKFPCIVLIESKKNLGFGRGNNLGVEHSKGEYILLLNNDTIILDNIDYCISYLKMNNDVGAIGINMLDEKKQYLQSTGTFPNLFNLLIFKKLFSSNKDLQNGTFSKDLYEVDWIIGSFMLMKKETYIAINGFDKDYFMYVEDIDICKKISKLNLKILFMPKFNYIHFVGFNSSKNKFIIQGLNIYINKHIKNQIVRFGYKSILSISKIIKCLKKYFKIYY